MGLFEKQNLLSLRWHMPETFWNSIVAAFAQHRTVPDVARSLGVSVKILEGWIRERPELFDSVVVNRRVRKRLHLDA